MKYLTKAWRSGSLPDSEVDRLRNNYWEYIEKNKNSFPTGIRLLATEINLHDGQFTSVVVNQSAKTLNMSLVVGDLQVGYEDLELKYSIVDFTRLSIDALRFLANSEQTEFLYDEIENLGNGNYEHRISFWPDSELSIQFKAVEIIRQPRKDRERVFNNAIFQTNT
jgi:hypothetical protein